VIHLPGVRAEAARAVEARAGLHVAQNVGVGLQRGALGPEEELVKVFGFAEYSAVGLQPADEPQPAAADQLLDESVEAPEREHHAGTELDVVDRLALVVRIEEVIALLAHRLQLPEGHLAHRPRDLPDDGPPASLVSARGRERAAELRVHAPDGLDDDRVRLGDLVKDRAVWRSAVRDDDRPGSDLGRASRRDVRKYLAPVVGEELVRDVRDRDTERGVGVSPRSTARSISAWTRANL
jgi:hypothetical protein